MPDEDLARDLEPVDIARAERLAAQILEQHGVGVKKWHDIDVTLARHIKRLQDLIASLEAQCKSQ